MNAFETWLKDPFHSNMSALDWGLFVGLLIVAVLLWNIILSHLAITARELV